MTNKNEIRKVRRVYRTCDSIYKYLQLYKIHSNSPTMDEALDNLILLGWTKYKELEDEKQKELL